MSANLLQGAQRKMQPRAAMPNPRKDVESIDAFAQNVLRSSQIKSTSLLLISELHRRQLVVLDGDRWLSRSEYAATIFFGATMNPAVLPLLVVSFVEAYV
jgi:hypothetical protein